MTPIRDDPRWEEWLENTKKGFEMKLPTDGAKIN